MQSPLVDFKNEPLVDFKENKIHVSEEGGGEGEGERGGGGGDVTVLHFFLAGEKHFLSQTHWNVPTTYLNLSLDRFSQLLQ